MPQWLDNLARRLGYAPARSHGRRDFAAAQVGRLTAGWSTANASANADLYRALDALRARSRDLCNNNDYAKRFLGMVGANVVGGTGFALQSRVYDAPGKPDSGANDAVETAWARWCRRGVCDVTGRMSFRDLQLLVAKTVARDGEALIRRIRGKSAGNPFGFALQVIDIDRLDTRLIRAAENGVAEIRMGVELDSFGRAVAYWLRGYHPGDTYGVAAGAVQAAHVRVPAADILHVYTAERPEQVRGAPWMHAAMTRLNNLGGYEEAAVIAARVGASKMGFFKTPDGQPPEDGVDENNVPYMEADAGSFGVLPPGTDFVPFNPDYPHAMYDAFVKACLRGIASGLSVSYHSLANDLEGVNFSSIRSGTLEERDQWISVQEWFRDAFLEPIFDEWIGSALAMGQIMLGNGSPLPADKRDKFSAHSFQGRRWSWVDPLKDMEAKILGIQNGLTSPQQVAAELGVDYEDVLVEIKRAQDLADKIGVKLGPPAAAPMPPVQAPDAAAKTRQDAVERNLADLRQQIADRPPVVIHNHPAPPAAPAEVRNEIHVEPAAAPNIEVRNEISVPEQPPAPVEVRVEAIMPEQPAPVVEVSVEAVMPERSEVAIVSMPDRVTTTEIGRDAAGNIVTSAQKETDA